MSYQLSDVKRSVLTLASDRLEFEFQFCHFWAIWTQASFLSFYEPLFPYLENEDWDFPGSPMVETPHIHHRRLGLDPSVRKIPKGSKKVSKEGSSDLFQEPHCLPTGWAFWDAICNRTFPSSRNSPMGHNRPTVHIHTDSSYIAGGSGKR